MPGQQGIAGCADLTASRIPLTQVTDTYTITAQDHWITCSDTKTLTLPTAASVGKGFRIVVQSIGSSKTVTVAPASGDTVQGTTSVTVTTQYTQRQLISDGVSNWICTLGV